VEAGLPPQIPGIITPGGTMEYKTVAFSPLEPGGANMWLLTRYRTVRFVVRNIE